MTKEIKRYEEIMKMNLKELIMYSCDVCLMAKEDKKNIEDYYKKVNKVIFFWNIKKIKFPTLNIEYFKEYHYYSKETGLSLYRISSFEKALNYLIIESKTKVINLEVARTIILSHLVAFSGESYTEIIRKKVERIKEKH